MIRVLLVGVALTGLGGGLTSPGVPVSGGRFTGGVGGPYAEFTIIDAGLLLCNGVPCVLPDGGLGGQFVDLVSNQTAGGIKTWSSVGNFNAGVDAGFVILNAGTEDSGNWHIQNRSLFGIVIRNESGAGIQIARRTTTAAGVIPSALVQLDNDAYVSGGASAATVHNPVLYNGGHGPTLATAGGTHAERSVAAFDGGANVPTFGYCTTDKVWYWGDGTAAHDMTCSTDSCTSQSFCAADGGSCWTGSPTGSCTLNGATPSVCTATVKAGTKCTCSPVGTTAVIAAGGCAVSLSSTTLTITGPAAASNDVNFNCQ